MGIRHAFTSGKAAAADATLVDGPDWDADHVGERAQSSTTPAAIGTAAVGAGTTDARADHVHATGAGTPTTAAFGDAAAIGTGPAAAMTDHKHGMPAAPAASLTSQIAHMTASVTLTLANTFYDLASLTLAAGTWLVIGRIGAYPTNNDVYTGRLLSGAASAEEGQAGPLATGPGESLTLAGIVVLGSSTTVKLQVAAVGTARIVPPTVATNGTANLATSLLAVRIA